VMHLCSIRSHGWSQSWPSENTDVAMKSPVVAYISRPAKSRYRIGLFANDVMVWRAILACTQLRAVSTLTIKQTLEFLGQWGIT
jgi:hypothetical protein